jgi:exodeoxyribonuclease VII small subunit
MAKKSSTKQPDFESALAELETLVSNMEQGDLSLEESLKLFERGIVLTRGCQESLKEAEQKVQILLSKSGEPEPFENDSDE